MHKISMRESVRASKSPEKITVYSMPQKNWSGSDFGGIEEWGRLGFVPVMMKGLDALEQQQLFASEWVCHPHV